MSLANLPKWTGDASNLTGLARKRSSSAETATWESDPAAGAEVAYLDGGATEIEPDGITQPGERLRVYNLAGYGEPLLLREVLISSKALADEAVALAYMRQSPYDVRPALLLLIQAQDLGQVHTCLRYAENYLLIWCERRNVRLTELARTCAALDGLALVYRLRNQRDQTRSTPELAAPATKSRAKFLRMRDDDYRRLRKVVVSVLQDRYLEAIADYAKASGANDVLIHERCRRWMPSKDKSRHRTRARKWRATGDGGRQVDL